MEKRALGILSPFLLNNTEDPPPRATKLAGKDTKVIILAIQKSREEEGNFNEHN